MTKPFDYWLLEPACPAYRQAGGRQIVSRLLVILGLLKDIYK